MAFPSEKTRKCKLLSIDATVLNNFQPILPPSTAKPTISHTISESTAPQNANSNHAATCSNQVNPFSTATNIDLFFVTPFFPLMYCHTAPAPFCRDGPPHPTPPVPASENASLIKAVTDALTTRRMTRYPTGSCPNTKGIPYSGTKWYGQFKSANDSSSSSNLVSTFFKANVEQDYELSCQVKSWHDMESHLTARSSRLTHDPQRIIARRKYLKQQLFIMAKDTMSVCYGLMTTSSSRITTFRDWYSSSHSKSGSRETQL